VYRGNFIDLLMTGRIKMKNAICISLALTVALLSVSWIASSQEQKSGMTFFITSVGSGKGADLGGLAGADEQCHPWRRRPGPATAPGVLT
jgi:hypothetical protein